MKNGPTRPWTCVVQRRSTAGRIASMRAHPRTWSMAGWKVDGWYTVDALAGKGSRYLSRRHSKVGQWAWRAVKAEIGMSGLADCCWADWKAARRASSELQTRNREQSHELETEPRARQWGPRSLRPWPRVAHAALGHGRLYPIGDRATPPNKS